METQGNQFEQSSSIIDESSFDTLVNNEGDDSTESIVDCFIEQRNGDRKGFSILKFALSSKRILSEIYNQQFYKGKIYFIENEVISDISINEFLKAINEENYSITPDNCLELYELSKEWETDKITTRIEKYFQENMNNIEIIISKYLYITQTSQTNNESNIIDLEIFEDKMRERIIECLQTPKFDQLPMKVIYRIIEKYYYIEEEKGEADGESEFQNVLFEFIEKSVEERKVLMNFIKIEKLSKGNQDIILDENSNQRYLSSFVFIRFPIKYIQAQSQEIYILKKQLEEKKSVIMSQIRDKEDQENRISMLQTEVIALKKHNDMKISQIVMFYFNEVSHF